MAFWFVVHAVNLLFGCQTLLVHALPRTRPGCAPALMGTSRRGASSRAVLPLALSKDARHHRFTDHLAWLPSGLRELLTNGNRFETLPGFKFETHFALRTAAPPDLGRASSTGILLENGRPLIVRSPTTDRVYLIELQGSGLPDGGFGRSAQFNVVRGGLMEPDGKLEFERARRAERPPPWIGPLALGYQRYRTSFGSQETVFRLIPVKD